jgi:hypothetical protein
MQGALSQRSYAATPAPSTPHLSSLAASDTGAEGESDSEPEDEPDEDEPGVTRITSPRAEVRRLRSRT